MLLGMGAVGKQGKIFVSFHREMLSSFAIAPMETMSLTSMSSDGHLAPPRHSSPFVKLSAPCSLLLYPLHLCAISQPTQLHDPLLKESQTTDGLFIEAPPNGLLPRQDDRNLGRFRLATLSSKFMLITVLRVQNLPSKLR